MKIINIGILAHVDAGKTTITEGLLVHSGVKKKMGRVDDGTTSTDSMALEQQRGMTIRATTISFDWKDMEAVDSAQQSSGDLGADGSGLAKINLIDTPGHMDFFAEVERSLSVLDGVILVISAREGVQPQTRAIFTRLAALRVPILLFVNKVDRIGVSLAEVYEDIRVQLTDDFIVMQHVSNAGDRAISVRAKSPDDPEFFEAIVLRDDALLADYVQGRPIDAPALNRSLRASVQRRALYPLYHGAALHDVGVAALLDAITRWFHGTEGSSDDLLSAYVYKIQWDAHDHKLAYLRVFSGALAIRERVPLVGSDEPVHVKGLLAMRGGQTMPAQRVSVGDVAILLDAPGVSCGDFLGIPTALPSFGTPSEPLLTVGIQPPADCGRNRLLNALQRLCQEDPVLQMTIHPQTEEITLRLYGALQREIVEALLWERFGIRAVFAPLQTIHKVRLREAALAEMRIWTQGNLHEAGIALTLTPRAAGSGNAYETKVSYGDLEKSFQNAVRDGVLQGMAEGNGCELIDTLASFTDMDYCSVTSTPADYRRLAPLVVRKALAEGSLQVMEPWISFTIQAPLSAQKKVLIAVNPLRMKIDRIEHQKNDFIVYGEAPLDTTKTFAADLLSMSQGQGFFDAQFLAYRDCDG